MADNSFLNPMPITPALYRGTEVPGPSPYADEEIEGSQTSFDTSRTVQRLPPSKARSQGSGRSTGSACLRIRNENIALGNDNLQPGSHPDRKRIKGTSPTRPRSNAITTPPPFYRQPGRLFDEESLEDIDLSGCHGESTLRRQSQDQHQTDISGEESIFGPKRTRITKATIQESVPKRPFIVANDHPFRGESPNHGWISNLLHERAVRRKSLTVRVERWDLDEPSESCPAKPNRAELRKAYGHRKASSWSSFGLTNARKKQELSFQSHKSSASRLLRAISRSTNGAERASPEVSQETVKVVERLEWNRAVQRRRVLAELVSSEESYIADLKVLLHVYLTILNSGSKAAQATQSGTTRIVQDMLVLHEGLLPQIKALISAVATKPDAPKVEDKATSHRRWLSYESFESLVPGLNVARRSLDVSRTRRSKGLQDEAAKPGEAADVAKVFEQVLERFFMYEEYGAKYESMLRKMTSSSRAMPNWSAYERGIEGLVNALLPQSNDADGSKKGITLEDLLIKPIQRICRYPLLFAELFKQTPSVDGAESAAVIGRVLWRLREMAQSVDSAANNEQTRTKIKRSWALQNLLEFPDDTMRSPSTRLLGHASLCGALFVAYQSDCDVLGNYMLCALFGSHLLLAMPTPGEIRLQIVAVIKTCDILIEKVANGRGLQCHTAPFSWKLLFESDHQSYELIFCACSEREEQEWKSALSHVIIDGASSKSHELLKTSLDFGYSTLYLYVNSLGPVFGQPGTLMRRLSIQRANTVNSDSRKINRQVIIKNTSSPREDGGSQMTASEILNRSKSSPSASKIAVLAPKRVERQRLEQTMAKAWTRDRLPYPGITSHRGDYLKNSASSVMRKLSRASTTTTSTSTYMPSIVSYTSIAEASPFTSHAGSCRLAQYDGACNPTPGSPTSLPSVEHGSENETFSNELNDTMVYVSAIGESAKKAQEDGRRDVSNISTVFANASRESLRLARVSGKSPKPKKSLKAMSTEGIRGLFRGHDKD